MSSRMCGLRTSAIFEMESSEIQGDLTAVK